MPSMDPSRATVADEITVVVGTEDCTLCATEAEGGITDCCTACLRCTGGAEERIVLCSWKSGPHSGAHYEMNKVGDEPLEKYEDYK
ncbi:hypothetical protein UY3_17049 [Chelonia mydas]|uniref:Uncharacterized protein n=1 Tax=Chelonia mydas TaxID=8469 RepID=M7AL49_CHEMY|nr:hypothetical protein UY3_17049 [Chelonia mydas]